MPLCWRTGQPALARWGQHSSRQELLACAGTLRHALQQPLCLTAQRVCPCRCMLLCCGWLGQTHTMGMGRALHTMAEHRGIIPRVIK